MKVYESFGTFDGVKKEFNLAVQTTIIGFDEYYISAYYDISNVNRYAIVAVLQTKNGNENDLSRSAANCAYIASNIPFSEFRKEYLKEGDLDINKAEKGDTIAVVVHHGNGFDPIIKDEDNLHIENYKADVQRFLGKGSPPGIGGKGGLF